MDADLVADVVDEALELGVDEVLDAVGLDADHLLDAGDADARESDLRRRQYRLDVGGGGGGDRLAGHRLTNSKRRASSTPGAVAQVCFSGLPIIRRGRSFGAGCPREWGEGAQRGQ